MTSKIFMAAIAAALIAPCGLSAAHAQQGSPQTPAISGKIDALMKRYNTGKDGKLTLEQAQKAAAARYENMDADEDGTLNQADIASTGMSSKDLTSANSNDLKLIKNNNYTESDYLSLVKQRFEAADPDHDGTLTKSELSSPDGQQLLRLLQ